MNHDPIQSALPAARVRPPGWRDLRLWVGLAIVAASVAGGAFLLGTADKTVPVWATARQLAPGAALTSDDLRVVRVRFAEPGEAARYLGAGEPIPEAAHALRDLGPGELLPRSAVGSAEEAGTVSVSVAVPSVQVPPQITAGSRVDVWVLPPQGGEPGKTELLLGEVVVIDAPALAGGFAGGTERQLVLGVPADADLAPLIEASGEARVMLVGRG